MLDITDICGSKGELRHLTRSDKLIWISAPVKSTFPVNCIMKLWEMGSNQDACVWAYIICLSCFCLLYNLVILYPLNQRALRFTASGDNPFSTAYQPAMDSPCVACGPRLFQDETRAARVFHVSDLSVIWWTLNYAPDLYLVRHITEIAPGLWKSSTLLTISFYH